MYTLILTIVFYSYQSSSASVHSVDGYQTQEDCLADGRTWNANVKATEGSAKSFFICTKQGRGR